MTKAKGSLHITLKNIGELQERTGILSEFGQACSIDPYCRYIVHYVYEGLLKFIPLEKQGNMKEAFTLRMEDEKDLQDLKFLHSTDLPVLAVLFQDHRENRHLKSYIIKDQALKDGPYSLPNVDDALFLIPVPPPVGKTLNLHSHFQVVVW